MILFAYTYKKAWESVLVARPTILRPSHCPSSLNGATQKPTREYMFIRISRVYLLCYVRRYNEEYTVTYPTLDIYRCFAFDLI